MSDSRNRLLVRVVAPATEPLTLDEAKLYLRVTDDAQDTLINDLIVTARMMAEQWLKRSLITQSWKLAYDDYVAECVQLPMGPVDSIGSVTIVNRDLTTQSISSSTYYLNAVRDTIVFQSALVGFRIEIVYSAGFGNASSVPRPVKQGMLAHIASMFDYRGEADASVLPAQSLALYVPYRGVVL
jgi:uncharacterized phiE125 gp8 family phage protein